MSSSDRPRALAAPNPSSLVWAGLAAVLALVGGSLVARTDGAAVGVLVAAPVLAFLAAAVVKDTRRGLYLIVLAVPLDVAGRLIAEPAVITVYHLALLLTLVSWAWRVLTRGRDRAIEVSLVHVGVLLLVLAALWSYPLSLDQGDTLVATVRLGFGAVLFLLFVQHLRDRLVLDRVLALLVGTSSVSALIALVQYRFPALGIGTTSALGSGIDGVARPAAFFSDPNYLAGLLSVGIITAVARVMHARSWVSAGPWIAGGLISSVGLVITLSRTGWVGVAVGLAVCVLTAPVERRARFAAALAAAGLVLFALAPGAIVERVTSITQTETDRSVATRVLMAQSTVEMIGDYWVFGTGLDAYDEAYPAYRRLGGRKDILEPHQLPLALPAEMGVLGLIAELVLVIGVGVEMFTRRVRSFDAWESVALAGLVALLVQSFFQYYLYFEYLWVFLALTVAASRLARSAEEV